MNTHLPSPEILKVGNLWPAFQHERNQMSKKELLSLEKSFLVLLYFFSLPACTPKAFEFETLVIFLSVLFPIG